jgi:hypothetical protein
MNNFSSGQLGLSSENKRRHLALECFGEPRVVVTVLHTTRDQHSAIDDRAADHDDPVIRGLLNQFLQVCDGVVHICIVLRIDSDVKQPAMTFL